MNKRILLLLFVSLTLFGNVYLNFDRASVYFNRGDYKKAVSVLKEILKKNSNYLPAVRLLARSYLRLGDFQRAVDMAKFGLRIDYRDKVCNVIFIKVYFKWKRYKELEEYVVRYYKRFPTSAVANIFMGKLYKAFNDVKSAKKYYKRAIRFDRNNYDAYIELGDMLIAEGYFGEAKEFLVKAAYIQPDRIEAYESLARLYYTIKIYDKAIYYINKALSIQPLNTNVNLMLANIKYLQKDYSNALSTYKKVVKWSSMPMVVYGMALCNEKLGKYNSAMDLYRMLLKLDKTDEFARIRLEELAVKWLDIYNADRADLALFHFDRAKFYKNRNIKLYSFYEIRSAIRLSPQNGRYRFFLAKLFLDMGFVNKYVNILKGIRGYSPDLLKEEIEFYKRKLVYLPSVEYGVSQYTIPRDKIGISIGSFVPYRNGRHVAVEDIIRKAIYRVGGIYYNKINISYSTNKALFFIEGEYKELDDGFNIKVSLHNAINRMLIREYQTTRYGNFSFIKSIIESVKQINKGLNPIGRVLFERNDKYIVNMGRIIGIKTNMVFSVLKDKVLPDYIINPPDNIMSIKAILYPVKIDENISICKIKQLNPYESILVNDYIVGYVPITRTNKSIK